VTDAPTCLCVSGYPSGRRNWERFAECAPPGVTVEVFELPDGRTTTLADQADALVERVEAMDGKIRLVGHSLGAYLVARVLPRLGDRVERAVPVGGFARLPAETVRGHAEIADALEAGTLAGAALRKLVYDVTVAPDPADAPGIELVDSMFLEPSGPDLARMIRRGLVTAEMDAALQPFSTPAVVVHGTDDRSVPLALAKELSALGSRATFLPIDGAGHFVQIFHPARVAAAVFA
jgi:pimeloyl-ACP methyl ester carboxylesterase